MANTKVTGSVIADGTITAAKIASGALDSIIGGYLTTNTYATESFVTTGYLPLSGGTLTGNLTVTGILTGTLSTAEQPNITSVGTLSSLAINGGLQINGSSNISTLLTDSDNSLIALVASSVLADNKPRIQIIGTAFASVQNEIHYLANTHAFFGSNASLGEKMRINSAGDVGIGTSSPSAKLTLDHSSSPRNYQIDFIGNSSSAKGHAGQFANGFYLSSNWYYNGGQYADDYSKGQAAIILSAADTTNSKIQFSLSSAGDASPAEKMRIDSSGNVGIGTTNADKKFTIADANTSVRFYGSGNDFVLADPISSLTRNVIFNNSGSGNLNVLFGTTSTPNGTANYGSSFSYEGDGIMALRLATSSTAQLAVARFFNPNGQVGEIKTQQSSTLYVTSSDYRLKEDFQPVANPLDRINALNPINFAWKSGGSRVDGFLAHEVADIVPEAVTGVKDEVDAEGNPVYQGIDQSKLVPLLTAAIQELKAEIETLKSQINA